MVAVLISSSGLNTLAVRASMAGMAASRVGFPAQDKPPALAAPSPGGVTLWRVGELRRSCSDAADRRGGSPPQQPLPLHVRSANKSPALVLKGWTRVCRCLRGESLTRQVNPFINQTSKGHPPVGWNSWVCYQHERDTCPPKPKREQGFVFGEAKTVNNPNVHQQEDELINCLFVLWNTTQQRKGTDHRCMPP